MTLLPVFSQTFGYPSLGIVKTLPEYWYWYWVLVRSIQKIGIGIGYCYSLFGNIGYLYWGKKVVLLRSAAHLAVSVYFWNQRTKRGWGPLTGAVSAQRALQGSEGPILCPLRGSLIRPLDISVIFFTKGQQKKNESVTWCHSAMPYWQRKLNWNQIVCQKLPDLLQRLRTKRRM